MDCLLVRRQRATGPMRTVSVKSAKMRTMAVRLSGYWNLAGK